MKVTLVPEHTAPLGLAAMLTEAASDEAIDMVMLLDVAGLPEGHVTVLVRTQVITSPLASDAEV